MSTVTINWTEPTIDTSNQPLPASAIKGTEVTVRNSAGTVVHQSTIAHGATQTVDTNLPAGTYAVAAITIDTLDRRGPAATKSAVVPVVNTAPGAPTNLNVAIS